MSAAIEDHGGHPLQLLLMTHTPPSPDPQADPAPPTAWSRIVARYREPRPARSLLEIAMTAVPLALIWTAAWLAVAHGYWWAVLLCVPAAGFVVRMFMIQHDAGHGSLFRARALNDWIGRVIGVFTLTPYADWRFAHGVHHASSGNLDRRGLGAVDMLTVEEYAALPRVRRLLYRLYRHPLVLFGLGPAYVFLVRQRLPAQLAGGGVKPWLGVMGANLATALFIAAGAWLFGPLVFVSVWLPTMIVAATIGVWLFYVQHQFESTFWARQTQWHPHAAALHGSSYYDLPAVARWFTANIGVHHVHHLNSRIPFYRLNEVLRDFPQLKTIGRMTVSESLATAPLALWDPNAGRLVSFREARSRLRADAASR